MSNNNVRSLYSLRRTNPDSNAWSTTWWGFGSIVQGGRSRYHRTTRWCSSRFATALKKYLVANLLDGWIGPSVGRYESGLPGDIVISADSKEAYICSVGGEVHVIDVDTMNAVHDPMPFRPLNGDTDKRVRNTNAALSPDGRYLVVNSGNRPALNVIDLVLRTSTTVDLEGLQETWDVAFNYAVPDHGLLAVHGRSVVAVYEFKGTNKPDLLASVTVSPQEFATWGKYTSVREIAWARVAALAWSGAGDDLIAAISSRAEWRILSFSRTGEPRLTRRTDFDSCTHPRGAGFELDVLTLNDRSAPTPTATASAVPSPTPSPTQSPTPPPTPTATGTTTSTRTVTVTPSPAPSVQPSRTPSPTATATSPPSRAYLPLALREQPCVPGNQRIDVALVIDASTTMRDDLTTGGRTKLAAAIEAANAFVGTLALPVDQAAVVGFNSEAWIEQPLTGDRAQIEAALVRIPGFVRERTRIDLGIQKAHEELTSARRKPANQPVMIVLTDGLANPEPASTAVRRAQAAKDDDITIFTIGLGEDDQLNVIELAQMASRPEYFYRVPDGEDLQTRSTGRSRSRSRARPRGIGGVASRPKCSWPCLTVRSGRHSPRHRGSAPWREACNPVGWPRGQQSHTSGRRA